MSVEERLRAGLTEYAAHLPEPDVELRFRRSLAIHRRRALRRVGVITGLAAAACAVVVLAVIWPGSSGRLSPAGDDAPPPTMTGSYAGLAEGLPGQPRSSGRWTLEFAAGAVTAIAPIGSGRGPEAAGTLTGNVLITGLFARDSCAGTSVGRYTLQRIGDRAVVRAVEDRCAARTALLNATTWVSTQTRTWNGPRIPPSCWVRDVTVDEMHQRGYFPAPDVLASNFLADGKGRTYLEFAGDKFFHFVEADDGSLVVGDQGDVSYDGLGRWVQNLNLAVEWSIEGDTLTTRNAAPVPEVRLADATPDEQYALEGTWHRVQ